MKTPHLCLVALCASMALVRPVVGQESAVRERLGFVEESMKALGYQPQGDPYLGALHDGNSYDMTSILRGPATFLIAGVCDLDCTDLDLIVSDPLDGEWGRDVSPGNVPTVGPAQVLQIASYRTRVIM